jgi:hypothetical protein
MTTELHDWVLILLGKAKRCDEVIDNVAFLDNLMADAAGVERRHPDGQCRRKAVWKVTFDDAEGHDVLHFCEAHLSKTEHQKCLVEPITGPNDSVTESTHLNLENNDFNQRLYEL